MKEIGLKVETFNCSSCVASCLESCKVKEETWFAEKGGNGTEFECFCSSDCKKT